MSEILNERRISLGCFPPALANAAARVFEEEKERRAETKRQAREGAKETAAAKRKEGVKI